MMEFCTGCMLRVDDGCAALSVKKCPSSCAFFKTPEQFHEAREKAYERIRALSPKRQTYIAATYYAGKIPWAK